MGIGKYVSWVSLAPGLSGGTDDPELSTWAATSFEDEREQVKGRKQEEQST